MGAERAPVLAIDGPGGSGKGTISQLCARRLGWHFLDSGALYRLVALAAARRNLDLDDEETLEALAANLDVRFMAGDPQQPGQVVLDGEDATEAIRTEECGNRASRVAALARVRSALLDRQRAFRREPGLVADGRDMGTVVFPDAVAKIFLTASPEERASRRYKQLKEKGINVSLPALLREIAERDARDSNRAVAPLKPAADAVVVDTTGLGIEQVFERVLEMLEKRLAD